MANLGAEWKVMSFSRKGCMGIKYLDQKYFLSFQM
jgi:hypothetical protein